LRARRVQSSAYISVPSVCVLFEFAFLNWDARRAQLRRMRRPPDRRLSRTSADVAFGADTATNEDMDFANSIVSATALRFNRDRLAQKNAAHQFFAGVSSSLP